MIRYVDLTFFLVYNLYKKWGDADPYYSTTFTLSVLVTSLINFIISITYFLTNWEILSFELFPIGLILVIILSSVMVFFYINRNHFKNIVEEINILSTKDRLMVIIFLILSFSTWFLAPFFYKWGYAPS